jgi:hypothetical protein
MLWSEPHVCTCYYCPTGTSVHFLELKRSWREADHSPHLVPSLKTSEAISHTPSMTWCLIKNKGLSATRHNVSQLQPRTVVS